MKIEEALLLELDKNIGTFIDVASKVKLYTPVYEDGWNAKHIIAHVVSWHDYYSSVIKAYAIGKEPPLYNESLAKVNLNRADEFAKLTRAELLKSFNKSHRTLTKYIHKLKTNKILYKVGSRTYTPNEYISIISNHALKHAKDLKRAMKK